jgi:hypothetical protein
MAIQPRPFAPGLIQSRNAGNLFSTLRSEFDGLQRQLSTGQRSDTFAGLGLERRTSLDMRARLSEIAGFRAGIQDGELRVKTMTQSLSRLSATAKDVTKQAVTGAFEPNVGGKTLAQNAAYQGLNLAVDLLNNEVNGRYLFGGRASDAPAGGELRHDPEGRRRPDRARGVRAPAQGRGFDARAARRVGGGHRHRDGGARGRVRVRLPLLGVASSNPAGHTASTAAPPRGGARQPLGGLRHLHGAVAANTQVSFEVGAPRRDPRDPHDDRQGGGPFGPKEFQASADPLAAAADLRTRLAAAISSDLVPKLKAASAVDASLDFFTVDPPPSPDGVDLRPMVDWYKGDTPPPLTPGGPPAYRETAPVQADVSQRVGARGRGERDPHRPGAGGPRRARRPELHTVADKDEHAALADRTRVALVAPAGSPSVDGIATEIGLAGATLGAAAERHGATEALLKDTLGSAENASREEVAAKLLALQTQLQASYQTTSMLSRLSLVNYL